MEQLAITRYLRYYSSCLLNSRRNVYRSTRGFTLIELLAVVIITGILSLLAVAGFRRHMQSARGAEALSVIQSIRSAEESYMSENHGYLNVSALDNWFPRPAPDTNRVAFFDSKSQHTDLPLWRQLAPSINRSVMFSYLAYAGVPGTIIPKLAVSKGPDFSAAQPLDWYVIQARGDVDGNSRFSLYASTSFTGEVYIENEGE